MYIYTFITNNHKHYCNNNNSNNTAVLYIYILVKFIVPSGTKETISGKMVIESWYVAMH